MGSRTAAVAVVAVAAATVAVYGTALVLDTTKDRPDTLDVDPVRSAAVAACTRLRVDLDALPPLPADAPPAARQDRLAAQDRAVTGLVSAVRSVGEPALRRDEPAQQWLADWESLGAARRAYAAAGATGAFTPPQADGRPVTDRMSRIGIAQCVVPDALTRAP